MYTSVHWLKEGKEGEGEGWRKRQTTVREERRVEGERVVIGRKKGSQ